jgi:hypothetical protein
MIRSKEEFLSGVVNLRKQRKKQTVDKVVYIMKQAGITVAQFEEVAGFPKTTVKDLLKDDKRVPNEKLTNAIDGYYAVVRKNYGVCNTKIERKRHPYRLAEYKTAKKKLRVYIKRFGGSKITKREMVDFVRAGWPKISDRVIEKELYDLVKAGFVGSNGGNRGRATTYRYLGGL